MAKKKSEEPKELTGQDLAVINANRGGRPAFKWTDKIEEQILGDIIAGKSIRQMAMEANGDFPSSDTIYRRIASDSGFCERYMRARVLQQDTYAEEIIAIADGVHPLFVGKEASDKHMAIEARKWKMGKIAPKKYNDHVIKLEVTGKDGAPLVPTNNIDVAMLTDEQRDALRFAITAIESREGEVEDINFEDGEDNE
jgi:hypothetical protein